MPSADFTERVEGTGSGPARMRGTDIATVVVGM
jgi:hypothetical protein